MKERLFDMKLTPLKANRAKCLDCSGHQCKEVRLCPVRTCALWPYRMGKRPIELKEPVYAGEEVDTCAG